MSEGSKTIAHTEAGREESAPVESGRRSVKLEDMAATLPLGLALFDSVAETLPQIVWAADADGVNTYLNRRWEEYTGQTVAQGLAQGWRQRLHPDDTDATEAAFEQARRRGASFEIELRLRSRDGDYHWFLTRGLPLVGEDGAVAAWFGTSTDIDSQKRTEKALRDSEARLRFLAESNTLLLSSLDYERTLKGVAALAVPSAADWCGVDLLDETGRLQRLAVAHVDPAKVVWAQDLQRRYPTDPDTPGTSYQAMRTGESLLYHSIPDEMLVAVAQDEEHLRLMREVGFTSAMIVPLIARSGTLGVLTFATAESGRRYDREDLTLAEELARRAAVAIENARLHNDTRRANAALEQRVRERTAELEESNAKLAQQARQLEVTNLELEAFSYSVSHDLRAPLRGIDGFAQALIEEFGEGLDGTAFHYLERIRSGAQRMGQLIDDLLGFSRLARREIGRNRVNLSALAEATLTAFAEREPARNVRWQIDPDLVATGDERLLAIVLDNLLGNAWKFTRGRDPAVIRFGGGQGEAGDVFYIQDNGVGFDMTYVDKIFGAFQRLHSDREFEGTGIGLATVQRIVHRHGGEVWAKAEIDGGATFFFTTG